MASSRFPAHTINSIVKVAGLVLLITLTIEFVALRLWDVDLSVPFHYWGDTLWFLIPVKGIVENGWAYEIPQLSAPFGLSAVAFPSMTNLDWLLMKAISLFTGEAARVLNLFWLFTIVLTAWTATLALRLLDINSRLAIGMAMAYAFLPYIFIRSVAHISLVYFCVPLLALLAIHIARGGDHPNTRLIRFVSLAGLVAQGFDYLYFSFFAVWLFVFAAWLGCAMNRSWRPIREAAIAIMVLVAVASVNLAPSIVSWHGHGKPPDMNYKSAAEAEIYALKLRKMLAPHEANQLPIASLWGRSDHGAGFPNDNENVAARLGPLAATGLLLLLMVSLGLVRQAPEKDGQQLKRIAALALFSFLFTTVGGFGAIFNQVLPDFRGYNRFSVFIAFFALAGLALWWQERMRLTGTQRGRTTLVAGLSLLWAFSLYDQLLGASRLNDRRPSDEATVRQERAYIEQLEAGVPAGTAVFQLPLTDFPPDPGKEKMLAYDHARPYLWSKRLRWSWPSFSQQHRNWLARLDGLSGEGLAEALALSNFGLVWIDRHGYADDGASMISALINAGASELVPGKSPRYVVLDLSAVAERLRRELGGQAFRKRQTDLLEAPWSNWRDGAYPTEINAQGRRFNWSRARSTVEIRHEGREPWRGYLIFHVASGKQGRFTANVGENTVSLVGSSVPAPVKLPLTLPPGSKTSVALRGDMNKVDAPGERRDLYFYIMDMHLLPDDAERGDGKQK